MKKFITIILLCAPILGFAQANSSNTLPNQAWQKYASVDEAAKQAITGVIKQMFDGMTAGDTSKIRTLFFDTNDRMQTVQHFFPSRIDTSSAVQFLAVADFLQRVGGMKQQGVAFEERILSYTVQRDGDFACVWCPYEVYVNGQFRHCGVDVFNLVKTQQGWKILHIADTRRKDGCK
jgi:hypothetical protein